jgi:L-ascorbate metabolism protein UlaG (beta-lactamase superfamily)
MKGIAKYRLAASTFIEPTVGKWPAWSGLVSPIPASLNLVHHQINLMVSYLSNPAAHVAAARDPELAGGNFMDIPVSRSEEVRNLLEQTRTKRAGSIELAYVFMKFVKQLASEAQGESLESFYLKIPDQLRGFVELVYDYFNRPNVRVLESLLYESKFYDPTLQSFVMSTLHEDGDRRFLVNTPRIPTGNEIELEVPFASEEIDKLFRLDTEPQALHEIAELFRSKYVDANAILPFLSDQPLSSPDTWREKGVRVRYFGHACVLVEWNGVSILTDAFIPVRPDRVGVSRFSFDDLPPRIDFVLITHNHHDHYSFETLLRLRHRIDCLVVPRSHGVLYGDLSLKWLSMKLGFRNVLELDPLESINLPDGEIVGAPFFGEHADLALGKSAYIVRCGKQRLLFAADSDCLDPEVYKNVRRYVGPVQTAFISTEGEGAPFSWVNGPLLPQKPKPEIDRQRRYHSCNGARALQLIEALGSSQIYVYAMGLEPWAEQLLGSVTGRDSERWRESEQLLKGARGRGAWVAKRLDGACSIELLDNARSGLMMTGQGPNERSRLAYWHERVREFEPLELQWNTPPSNVVNETSMNTAMVYPVIGEIADDGQWAQFDLLTISVVAFLCSVIPLTEQEDIGFVLQCDCANAEGGTVSHLRFPMEVDMSGDPAISGIRDRVSHLIEGAMIHRISESAMSDTIRQLEERMRRQHTGIELLVCLGTPSSEVALDQSNEPNRASLRIILSQQGANSFVFSVQSRSAELDESFCSQFGDYLGKALEIASKSPDQRLSEVRRIFRLQTKSKAARAEAEFQF